MTCNCQTCDKRLLSNLSLVVNLKELTDAKRAGIGCRTKGPDENGKWNCEGLLNGVEISGDGVITKKSLLDFNCKSLCQAFGKYVCQILD